MYFTYFRTEEVYIFYQELENSTCDIFFGSKDLTNFTFNLITD